MSEKKKIKIKVESEETPVEKNTDADRFAPVDEQQGDQSNEIGANEQADAESQLKELQTKLEAKEQEAKETDDRKHFFE